MVQIEVKGQLTEEEISEVTSLLDAAEEVDRHAPLGEQTWLDLLGGERALVVGLLGREPDGGRLVGYAQVSRGSASWEIEVVVHPGQGNARFPVRADLLRAALTETRRAGGGRVQVWVSKATASDDDLATTVGLARGRDLLQMRRSLPLEAGLAAASAPVGTRPFRIGADEGPWLALNNLAFGDHPEQGSWTLETLLGRESQPWFDPAGFLLVEDATDLVGFCWTKIHPGKVPLGEIYVLGTHPRRRSAGLGRALLTAGCQYLSGRGLEEVMLYVDASNDRAVRLYAGLGFEVDHHDRAYVGDVAPAVDPPGAGRSRSTMAVRSGR